MQGLDFSAAASVSIKSYTSNITYGNISSAVSFMGASANLSAAFFTGPAGSELQNVLISFSYSQDVFAMTAQLDYNSDCVPGASGAIGSGAFALISGDSIASDASFDLYVAYFKCASEDQTKWNLTATREQPLEWSGVTLSNAEVHLIGTAGPQNSTSWSGELQGTLQFAGIAVAGSVSFDGSEINDLFASLSINSTYLDLTASIQYKAVNCSLADNNRNISGPTDPNFLGSLGQATIRIHNICISKYIYLDTLSLIIS